MRWLRLISLVLWIFAWRTIYLEIFRWHHMTKSLRFNPPPPPPGTDIRPRAGAPLIAVCVGAVAAPLVFVTATVVERVRGRMIVGDRRDAFTAALVSYLRRLRADRRAVGG
jgi:hypothetical protein